MSESLTPEMLIQAYRAGIFPMAIPERQNAIYWFAPDPRTILPLDGLRVSHSLRRVVRAGRFRVTRDQAFEAVMRACAAPRESAHGGTWISEDIIACYVALHRLGHAHSVECWLGSELVGGLYGVAQGAAFCGESMFHTATDASKVALVHLVEYLNAQGYTLLDTQFTTPHLARLGAVEIPRRDYDRRLAAALRLAPLWQPLA